MPFGRVVLTLGAAGWLGPLAMGCDGLTLYSVNRALAEECDITPAGEFCSEGRVEVQEVFAIESRDGFDLAYFQDEAWVLPHPEDPEAPLGSRKEQRTTRDPGPCTSTLQRELTLRHDGLSLQGELEERTRIEGPAACGETPRGSRRRYLLSGSLTGTL